MAMMVASCLVSSIMIHSKKPLVDGLEPSLLAEPDLVVSQLVLLLWRLVRLRMAALPVPRTQTRSNKSLRRLVACGTLTALSRLLRPLMTSTEEKVCHWSYLLTGEVSLAVKETCTMKS